MGNNTEIIESLKYRPSRSFYNNDIDKRIVNFLNESILNLTTRYGINFNPFINGRYMVFMINGPWYNDIFTSNNKDIKDFISEHDDLNKFKSNHNFINKYSMLATDIDIPEPTKEYTNISSRSQTITHYQRETLIPDFNISYVEDNDMFTIRYHEMWHKTIELYRRGKIPMNNIQNTKSPYFYTVPYTNGVFILLFDVQYNVRGLIYLVGVKPVSLPLKQVIGNRSGGKLTTYNIQYKTTNMYYKFFKDMKSFDNYINASNGNEQGVLSKLFVNNLLKQ